ncbi:N-acetyl sugar amidotransferase [Mesoflavibacter zeaxanthinifaciens]|uniref:N-acetyl sugar amidotransferase n=1 Tax=Mesoflavibacter zeaxanthinifaciens TaxID=393060 RepID=UPI003A93FB4A
MTKFKHIPWYIKDEENLQICTKGLYDNSVPNIAFDENGVCNYNNLITEMSEIYPGGEKGEKELQSIVDDIKKAGKGKKYDCVIGVSGGCDSSYMLYLMKEKYGLRPLAAHFDNTWNSSIATENIRKVLSALDIDLFTIVVDNKEYDDIYRSFIEAGVPDIEAPTDIGLATTLWKAAAKYNIKYMLQGHNFRTEGNAPLGWLYMDGGYISDVHKKFGKIKMKTFPNLWFSTFMKFILINRIKQIRPLYYLDYNKEEVKKFLTEKYDWEWYGGHHLENRFTAFYHSYFLPKRFGIDQRVNGFNALVNNGQMDRDEALKELSIPPHFSDENLDYVKKRLGYTDERFNELMNAPKKFYTDFKTYKSRFEKLRPFFYLMYKMNLVPYGFYKKYTSKNQI